MEVADLFRALRRRWVLTFLVIVLAAGGSVWTYSHTQPTLQSTSSVLILPPSTRSDPNPLLGLDNNLSQLAVVLAATLESDATRQLLAKQNATAGYSIQTVANTAQNVAQLSARLEFTTSSASAQIAELTATALVQQASDQLALLQTRMSVKSGDEVQVLPLSAASQAVPVGNGRSRAAGATAAGLLVIGAGLVILLDYALGRRRVFAGRRPATRLRARPRPHADGATEQALSRSKS